VGLVVALKLDIEPVGEARGEGFEAGAGEIVGPRGDQPVERAVGAARQREKALSQTSEASRIRFM
jgi:hypothetical protein